MRPPQAGEHQQRSIAHCLVDFGLPDDRIAFAQKRPHAYIVYSDSGPYERRVVPGVGHNLPQESPTTVVKAVSDLLAHE